MNSISPTVITTLITLLILLTAGALAMYRIERKRGQPTIKRSLGARDTHLCVILVIERGDIRNLVDPRLQGQFNDNAAWKIAEIAMSCITKRCSKTGHESCIGEESRNVWVLRRILEDLPNVNHQHKFGVIYLKRSH
ncbi:hypothetical protein Patl1_33914 [Pistacia atlantica]|uniref:Uncharacterized protein n=1 Tax=Pistacia atlantica TaxID=434234 RepID=A0ACC0ZT70_9ROSI|nr:hypothetical protein Patl1_33914 [Pistacia atlantica]